ncbi:MAG: primosomal protein N' [Clostridia bacterium]|nr:primosomal protein N' [Clostridia bacterium]
MAYAQIVIDINHSAVDRFFTYRIPDALPVKPGHHVFVPFGQGDRLKEGFVVALSDSTDLDPSAVKDIVRIIEPYPVLTEDQLALAKWMHTAYHCLFIDALCCMIPAQLRGQRVREKKVATVSIAPDINPEEQIALLMHAPVQQTVLRIVKDAGVIPKNEIGKLLPGASNAVRALLGKGILTEGSETVFRKPSSPVIPTAFHTLTEGQSNAVDTIVQSMNGPDHKTVLLHGVTGSGKTEVYLNAIRACIDRGKQAIVLVPEISLTPQTVGRFADRFGSRIAVLHSRLSVGERFDEWRRIRLKMADIVIGARSAVFAPVENLGLIIIDEEHESSYQSEKTPRYSAIDVAAQRAKLSGCTLVLGSATPQLISYYRALSGRYTLCSLPDRVAGRPLPEVEVINMRDELLLGNNSIFSDRLIELLSTTIGTGKQAMLFINRRGYSTFVSCRSCGYVLKCDNCDISLTYHKVEGRARCHYCGMTKPLPKECPNCGKPFLKQFGIGTEQVEETLHKLFPTVRSLRMDTDTMRTKDAYSRILSAFASGQAQVLIGTQMIAKGHDFPNVTLVGVVAADTTLNLPDYRSAERTFQLLTQVAGRAGRDETPGRVVLQTYAPQHPIIRFAREQNYPAFYQYEIAERKKMLYPPFSLFLRVVFSDTEEQKAAEACIAYAKSLEQELRKLLGEEGKNDILLFVAAEAPVARISGLTRFQLLVKLLRTKRLPDAIRLVYEFQSKSSDLCQSVELEVNPQDMY